MKELYTPEVANELGYQKYWPEKSDWIKATGGVLVGMAIIIFIVLYIMDRTGHTARADKQIQDRKSAITEWCKNSPVKNLTETKECLNYN